MHFLKLPSWVKEHEYPYEKFEDIPKEVFAKINAGLDQLQSKEPLMTILIAAYNEEVNLLRCISSLSRQQTNIPFDIIVINNNSKDKTQETINKLHLKSMFQPIQGCGPARQIGQEQALGKYILIADADCIYPSAWINEMMKVLQRPNTACVYGRYSFIEEPGYPRWQLFFFEKMKDLAADIKQIKRPYLNVYGISMGYVKEYGLKAGYIMHNTRGDDGRLAFDMMPYGKIRPVKSSQARVWTGARTLQRDGSLFNALTKRIRTEALSFPDNLTTHPPHDTKTSKN